MVEISRIERLPDGTLRVYKPNGSSHDFPTMHSLVRRVQNRARMRNDNAEFYELMASILAEDPRLENLSSHDGKRGDFVVTVTEPTR